VNDFWFEIVRRSRNRYAWVFIGVRDGRPRVLAESGRDYRSRKKARRAIARLRYEVQDAEIRRPFTLPRTRFQRVPGVVPLIVDGGVSSSASISHGGSVRTRPRRVHGAQETAEQQTAAAEQETPKEDAPVAAGRKGKAT
jgi:uncharacterized protein YegP (UPF0339 family)